MMYAQTRTRELDYILGSFEFSIASNREWYLQELNNLSSDTLKIAIKDPISNIWTKHLPFSKSFNREQLQTAYDIHRGILPNEIVVESDHQDYEENYRVICCIGQVLESQGFKPLYYYSGNKSIHIHMFFDFKCLLNTPLSLQKEVMKRIRYKSAFIKKFMEWLRTKIIKEWGNGKGFDENLINSTHLIRSELSRNKMGYKTFLGYSYKEINQSPVICNENTKLYPKLGEIRLSSPKNPTRLLEEFLFEMDIKKIKKRNLERKTLLNWTEGNLPKEIKFMLSDEFIKIGDGTSRAMFILANELKKHYPKEKVYSVLLDWNSKLDKPLLEKEIKYRIEKNKEYSISKQYIIKFLLSLGVSKL